ncbi:MAG: restriction endonuclease subunit S [Prolixibacteraceae bacterium]|jgi:restriction endonuclease S subunit|nr:restriction endonuclease subunit S [Prolixibacteraceae bacterium]
MKALSVKHKWFGESDLRLDASYHLSDGPLTKLKLKKSPYEVTSLKRVTEDVFKGNIFKRTYVDNPETGFHFMTASDMMKSNIESGKFVSKKYTDTANLLLKKGWILVSRSGTLGNTVYTNEDFEGVLGTDDLIRIIPCEKEILGGYMYGYLSSKYGYGLLTQSGYGGVVQHIEPHHIEDLSIPILPDSKQQEIHNLILEASNLRVEANKLLSEAVEYFESFIGESKVHLGFQTGKISSKSLNSYHKRLDSQFQLLWNDLESEEIESINYEKVYDNAKSIFVGGRGKRNYVEKGVAFLSSSDMMLFNPKRGCKYVSKNNPGLDSMMVSKKDILISRSGTVGNTVLVGEDLAGTAISEHALRLVINPDKISPNYVFCFLKTKYGMKSMEASSFGSVIITLNEDLIGNINLPILDQGSQDKINELIESYLVKMDEATKKENQAIDLVEKEIESWQK